MFQKTGTGTAGTAGSPTEPALDGDFERFVDRTVDAMLAQDPVRASWLGVGGPAGAAWPDPSVEASQSQIAGARDLLRACEAFVPARLHPLQRTDRALAVARLSLLIDELETRPRWRVMPQAAVEEVLSGVTAHLFRECAPPDERWPALLGRLESVEGFLAAASRALAPSPPALFTEGASLAAEEAVRFLPAAIGSAIPRVPDPAMRRGLERAAAGAVRGLRGYAEFLRGTLMPRSTGEFRLGSGALHHLLRTEHRIALDLADLVQIGERTYHDTLRRVRALAAEILPGGNWSRLLDELKEDHPDDEALVAAYERAVAEARAFVAANGLVTFPAREELRVLPAPEFARTRLAPATYLGCGHFACGGRGAFLVTPAGPAEPPHRRCLSLRTHSRYAIAVRAAQEAYPGRHLQYALLPGCGRKLRLLCANTLLAEGWTLYCGELLVEAGYAPDPRVRFLQAREQLHCACRVLVDVGLHTGKLSWNDAVGFLVRKAKLERTHAVREVRICAERPSWALSGLLGKLLIEELRDECRVRLGGRFSLRAFHDDLLSHGVLPPELLAREMGVPFEQGGRELLRRLQPAERRGRGAPRPAAS